MREHGKVLKTNGIVETALSVSDVRRSADFYQSLFGFKSMLDDDELCALAVPGNAVLLLFKKGTRLEPFETPGGTIPAHDASGRMHLSFKISAESLDDSKRELTARGIPIESRVDWPRGGSSLYFRDPDEHLVELITPGVWENY
jgi:catechol 2,3-dioxygenase-like lactoylglutathione lyase family enzyme